MRCSHKRKTQTICVVISSLYPLLDAAAWRQGRVCLTQRQSRGNTSICCEHASSPAQPRVFKLSAHLYLSCLALLIGFSPLGVPLPQNSCATIQTEIQHPLRPSPGIKISASSPGTRHCDWLPFWHNKEERKKDNRIWVLFFFFLFRHGIFLSFHITYLIKIFILVVTTKK